MSFTNFLGGREFSTRQNKSIKNTFLLGARAFEICPSDRKIKGLLMWASSEAIKKAHPSEIRGKSKKTRGLFL